MSDQSNLSNVSLEERAYRIRRNALRMGEVQGQGYIAQARPVVSVHRSLRHRTLCRND